MKKSIIIMLVLCLAFVSCKKDPAYVSKEVPVTYPTINLKGPAFVHIPVNGSFTDPGATLIDDITGASSDIGPTSNDIDATTQGMYSVKYTAANANGFKTTTTRVILVLNYTPPPTLDSNFDISGQYLRAATGVICNIVKMDNGLYITDNVGGSTPNPAYIITPDTNSFTLPLQTSFGGLSLNSTSEVLIKTPPYTLKYKIVADSYGPSLRTFVKQ